jgi:hypothetical protein
MQVTINGEREEVSLTLKRAAGQLGAEELYVNDRPVVRVTHSRADDVPVFLVVDEDTVVEVDPPSFYAIDGMHYDWQPEAQARSVAEGSGT